MSWASARRTLILGVVSSAIIAFIAVVLIATLYETPSCNDGKKNQDEEGVDCGGSCDKVCTLSTVPPVVQFIRYLPITNGRTDIIAYVENKNGDSAARDISYTIELFGDDHTTVGTLHGTVDLPPASGVPIYLPNAYSGVAPVVQAFITFDETSSPWYKYVDTRNIPRVEQIETTNVDTAPRVSAVVKNTSVDTLRNVRIVAIVYDEADNAVAASQTVIAELKAQGSATAIFTWSAPFSGDPARIEVRPIIPLP